MAKVKITRWGKVTIEFEGEQIKIDSFQFDSENFLETVYLSDCVGAIISQLRRSQYALKKQEAKAREAGLAPRWFDNYGDKQ